MAVLPIGFRTGAYDATGQPLPGPQSTPTAFRTGAYDTTGQPVNQPVLAPIPPVRPVVNTSNQPVPNPAAQPSWWQQMFGLGGNRGMTAMLMDRAGGAGSGATRI